MTPTRAARGTVLAAATLTIMAPALIAPSLPAMEQVYGSPLLVRLTMTITSLAVAVTAPLSGLAADRAGRRPLLVASLLLYTVSGTAGYFTTDLILLLVTRTLLGVAVGGIMTSVNATITDWFDGPARASFLGLQQVFASLSGVVFLPVAGMLATIGWRVPFWLYGVAAVVALFALAAVHDRPRASAPAVVTQRAMTGPVLGICVLALVATTLFYMAPTQVPFLLAEQGIGPVLVGVVVAGGTATSMLGGYGFPALRRRLDPAAVNALCVGLLGGGWLLVGSTGTATGIAAGLLVGGLGVGFAIPNLTLRLSDLAPPAARGRVFGGLVSGIFLGQFVSPLVVQPLVRTVGVADAFTWTGALMVAGAAVARITHKERTVR
ncbi:MFS transporter [Actinophytocola oryzae]|uniref:Putative MFS family arabinose efflux permease n=1 Tax=Actinophytocola oryzae TaxID=502181 RepID=A0A4R7W0W2_9PSEU|nr:MFS transporter [Actinophytocola oryzae]TDV56166.1 putative MFS family arabinose efflux permease [Actinophytocola oryzae]